MAFTIRTMTLVKTRGLIYRLGLCLLLTVSLTTRAQVYTFISPMEVKERFLHRQDATELLNGRDRMLDYPMYIAPNKRLSHAEGLDLPPSYWGLMIGNKQSGYVFESRMRPLKEGEQCLLCWMGLRENSLGKEKKIRQKMQRRYGCVKSADGSKDGIPATWISDTLTFISDTECYEGLILGIGNEKAVRNGTVLFHQSIDLPTPFEEMSISQEDLDAYPNATPLAIQSAEMKLYAKQDSWIHKMSIRDISMVMLSYNVNRACATSFMTYREIDIPIYVYMKSDGRCEMIVLNDNGLKSEDFPFVRELQEAFCKLPIRLFGFDTTIDGTIMSGTILYASRRTAWTFQEAERK